MVRNPNRPESAAHPRLERRSHRQLPLALALALAVAGLSLTAVACGGGKEAPPPMISVPPDDPKALGPADAPLTVIEYADFQ